MPQRPDSSTESDDDALLDDDFDPSCPVLNELLTDALAPYLNALTPEEVEEERAFLTLYITTHPHMEPIYQRLRKRRGLGGSGELRKRPVDHGGD